MKKYLYIILGGIVGLIFSIAGIAYGVTLFSVQQGGTGAGTLTGCLTGNGTSPITGTGSACGSGGGGNGDWPWSLTPYAGVTTDATSTPLWLRATTPFSLLASSTLFNNASTTLLTVSNTAYLPLGIWNSSGNVGIGNTSPGAGFALDVTGVVNGTKFIAVQGSTDRSGDFENTRASGNNYGIITAATGATVGTNIGTYADAINGGSNYSFYGNTGVLYNSGNVGFGTTTPATKTSLYASDDTALTVYRGSPSTRIAYVGDSGSNNSGDVLLYDSAGTLKDLLSGGTDSYFNAGGLAVGGTTVLSGAKLDVEGGQYINNTGKPNIVFNSAGVNYGDIQNDTTGTWSLGYGTNVSSLNTSVLTWTSSGNVGIGTTTPSWILNPFSSTASQLALSEGVGKSQWAFRNAGGNFYLSTTTIVGTATTSTAALWIAGGGFGTTTIQGLSIVNGQATSTSNVGFNITTGCYAINGTCSAGGGGGGSGTVTSVATNNGLTGGTITTTGTLGLDISKLYSGANVGWNGSQLVATGTGGGGLTIDYLLATTSLGTATSTFTHAIRLGTVAAAKDNLFNVDCSTRVWPASISVGGCVNIDNGTVNSGPALELQTNFGASATGRLFVINERNSAFDQDVMLASSSAANTTVLNLKGAPTGKGILKIEHTGNLTDSNANSSGMSIDLLACGSCQGFFIDSTLASTTGNLANFRNKGQQLFTIDHSGSAGLGTSTPYAALSVLSMNPATTTAGFWTYPGQTADVLHVGYNSGVALKVQAGGFGTTTLSGLTVSGSATSTSNVGFNLTAGCFAISGTCISGSGGGGSGTVTSVGLSLPSAFTVTNSPVTTTGTLTATVNFPKNSILTSDSNGTNIIATTSQLTVGSLLATSTVTNSIFLNNWTSFGTSTNPLGASVVIASSTTSQLALSSGVAGIPQWTMRNAGGILYFSTTTAVGTATSSISALALTNSQILIPDGTASSPSVAFLDDSNNGIGSPANDIFSIYTNGLERIRFDDGTGRASIATSSSTIAPLTIASSTAPQLSLGDGTAGVPQWTMRSAGGNLYLGTTTAAGTATSTAIAALSLLNTGAPSISSGTSTPVGSYAFSSSNGLSGNNVSVANIFVVASTSATQMRIDNSGHVFMPTLTTSGSGQTYDVCADGNGQLILDTVACIVSALKFKTDIHPLNLGLDAVLEMKPVTFAYKDKTFGQGEQIGFIADWSEDVVPQLIGHDSKGEVHSFNYQQYTAVITKAIQDFYKQFQKLVARVSGLEAKVENQQKQIDSLQEQINQLKK